MPPDNPEREQPAPAHLLLRHVCVADAAVLVPALGVSMVMLVAGVVVSRLGAPRSEPGEQQIRADDDDDRPRRDAQDRIELVRRDDDGSGQAQQAKRQHADGVRHRHRQTQTQAWRALPREPTR